MRTGYREMLRDRCPKMVSLALKYCKAKERWLDHVYKSRIWIYVSNEERLRATKEVINTFNDKHKPFNFDNTIDWDNLTSEDVRYWKIISGWVLWFQRKYKYVENEYNLYKNKCDIVNLKRNIMLNYFAHMCPTTEDDEETRVSKSKTLNELVDYLIECFENS